MNCPLCTGAMSPLFFHNEYEVVWCRACEFGRLKGNFTPEQVAKFYPSDYYTHINSPPKAAIERSFSDKLISHVAWRCDFGQDFRPSELPPGKTACDIGCGNGMKLRALRSAGYDVAGVDPDPAARAAAREFTVYDGTAESLPRLGEFDVVIMSHVLEHCIDPVASIKNAKSIMAHGGTLAIEVPNNAALGFSWFKGAWPWSDIPRHISFFTDKSLEVLCASQQLTITKVTYTGYVRQFSPEWRIAIGNFASGWPLLACSALAPDRKKYDSIRIHAIKS